MKYGNSKIEYLYNHCLLSAGTRTLVIPIPVNVQVQL